jgi:hypothetical protein
MGERDRRRVGFWIRSRDLFVAETGTLVNAHVAESSYPEFGITAFIPTFRLSRLGVVGVVVRLCFRG